MGSKREDVKNIREKIFQWLSARRSLIISLIKSWLSCLIQYSSLFVIVCGLGFIIFSTSGLSETNIDNARYMLSALVQGQAAIISIVITLTLVAVQLSASAYSPRVIDIMKKNPDMWILLSVYAVLICYGLMVLKSLEVSYIQVAVGEGTVYYGTLENSPAVFGRSFEELVYYAYVLGAFSVFALIPYMINTISLLKPEYIIKKLVNEIDESNILDENGSGFQPVFDVIHGAIAKYDLTTTRNGLDAVGGRVKEIIDKTDESQKKERSAKISETFCSYLKRCAFAAINNDDEEVVSVLANTARNWDSFLAKKGLEDATVRVADALENVGEKAADQGLEDATMRVADALGTVGVKAADQRLEEATRRATYALETVGGKTAEKGLGEATKRATYALGGIGLNAVYNGLKKETVRVADALGSIGVKAAENGLEEATASVAAITGTVGERAANKGLYSEILSLVNVILKLGIKALSKGYSSALFILAEYLAKMRIQSEKIVLDAIEEYESEISKDEKEAFYKFIDLYENQFKKLTELKENS